MDTHLTLLPCPFCGGDEILVVEDSRENWPEPDFVFCRTCMSPYEQIEKRHWNNRAQPEAPASTEYAPRLEWSDTLLGGETATYTEAEEAVSALGEGWRLPTREELESLLDLSRHNPAIDTDKHPDTKNDWYWTSTPTACNENAVWVVAFGFGAVDYYNRNYHGCVRACRSQSDE